MHELTLHFLLLIFSLICTLVPCIDGVIHEARQSCSHRQNFSLAVRNMKAIIMPRQYAVLCFIGTQFTFLKVKFSAY